MKHRTVFSAVSLCILLAFIVGSIGGTAADPDFRGHGVDETMVNLDREADASSTAVLSPRNRVVPNVPVAFAELTYQGEWQDFYHNNAPHAEEIWICQDYHGFELHVDLCMPYGLHPDTCCQTREQHFQGIARRPHTTGTPIF